MNRMFSLLDGYIKETKEFNEEKLVLQHRVDKIDVWVEKGAKKLGIEYNA